MGTRAKTAKNFADEMAAAYKQADAYQQMRTLAESLGLEYEVERFAAQVNEMHGEVDDLIEQAILAGFDCDDIEAAGMVSD